MKLRKVTDRLYRGDQPEFDDFDELVALGINTIVNLRREDRATLQAEREQARKHGMRFYHFPFYGIFGARTSFLDSILREVTRPENGVVLVHCRDGRDRTSLIVGLHQVIHGGSSVDDSWKQDFVAHGHDPDNPQPPWKSRGANFFYRNVRRTFLRHTRKRVRRH